MARRLTIAVPLAAGVLALGAVARAATVTVNATVAGGTTLSVGSQNSPSFNLTLNGDDQTTSYQAQLQVVDARGLASGGGWNLTFGATQFTSSGGKTFPSNASTISSVTTACHSGSTCALPANNVTSTDLAVSSTPTKILNAATASGLGRVDVNVNVNVSVPANTIASTYTSTLTVAIASGP